MTTSLYVITGGPGCGKTTLCSELYTQGYVVLPEVARRLIRENEANSGPLPWTNFEGFQRQVMMRQKSLESTARSLDAIVFTDRALPDTLGYYYASRNFDVPLDIKLDIHRQKYAQVFLLEPLEHYATDAQRKESRAEMLTIHSALYAGYQEIGHEPVIVPAISLAERVKFILNHVYKGGEKDAA